MNRLFTLLLLMLVALPLSFATAQSSESGKLYVTVIEQVGDPAQVITNAKVSLAYGSLGGEQSQPGAWQDVSTQSGQAVFSGLADNYVYTVSAKAPGYLPAQKEFKKQPGEAGHISIALTKAPIGSVGSVRVAVLVQAPQSPIALTTAKIEILRAGKSVATADTKNTKGKEGVVFSKLPIGEDYEAYVTAPDYESQRKSFAVETNKETWLPIDLERVQIKPETCPENCSCDSEGNIIYCAAPGESDKPGAKITTQAAAKNAVEQTQLDAVKTVEEGISDGKTVYEVEGISKVRLFAFIPIQMKIKVVIDAEDGSIKRIQKPWWSFLTRYVG